MDHTNEVIQLIPGSANADGILEKLYKCRADLLVIDRAVTLDEEALKTMQEVLYRCDRHAVVYPRIIDVKGSSFYTFPIHINDGTEISVDKRKHLHDSAQNYLRDYYLVEKADCPAALLRGDVLRKFDFSKTLIRELAEGNAILESIVDYSRRINNYGYSTLLSNHAAAFAEDIVSQTEVKAEICMNDPVDYFSDLLTDDIYPRQRILYSLYELSGERNGSAVHALSLLQALSERFSGKYDIYVLAKHDVKKAFGLEEAGYSVIEPEELSGNSFHLVYSPVQVADPDHYKLLVKSGLKVAACIQDVIFLRCRYLLKKEPWRMDIMRLMLRSADGLTVISHSVQKDVKALFPDEYPDDIPLRTIYMAGDDTERKTECDDTAKLPFDSYYLCMGNVHIHKRINDIISKLSDTDRNIIVVGTAKEGFQNGKKTIYGYPSGWLEDSFMSKLKAGASGLIFPSVYEGFGIPFLEGLQSGKPLIASDTDVNRELIDIFAEGSEQVYLIDSLSDITGVLESIDSRELKEEHAAIKKRSWKDATEELDQFFQEVINRPLNPERLYWRHDICGKQYITEKDYGKQIKINHFYGWCIEHFPRLYRVYRRMTSAAEKR